MKRYLTLACFCPMAIGIAMGQGSAWSHTIDQLGLSTFVEDAIETTEGAVVAVVGINPIDYNEGGTDVAFLNNNGVPVQTRTIWADYPYAAARCILPRTSGQGFDVVGVLRTTDGRWKFFSYAFDEAGNRLDSSTMHVPNMERVFMDNAIRTSNGDLLFAGSATPNGDFNYTRLTMARMSESGDSLDYAEFTNPFSFFAPRDVVELVPDTFMVSSTAGFVELGNEFAGSFLTRIGPDLQPIDALPPLAVNGSGAPPGWYNSFTDTQHLVLLESGDLIIGGRVGTGNEGTYGALLKVGPTGEWLGSFIPESDPASHPGFTGTVDRTLTGGLLFSIMDSLNFFPGPYQPLAPNHIHVYELDTALNVLCTNVVDGFAENAYYFLNRIKATNDGGYILVGSRVDMSQPEIRFEGWARKFTAEDCFTGLHEQIGTSPPQVFPNPGSDHFTITLNGPERSATVQLHNTSGEIIRSEKLRFGVSRMETADLASGMYLYRVLDEQGRAIASGSWVKE